MKLTVFGRDPQQADVVLSSTFVSGYHAELIQLDNGDMYLVDKSSNGTLLNGSKLVPGKETPVRRGDNVMFADVPLNWNQIEDLRLPANVKVVKTIGAHYTNDIKLQGAAVSRFHAALRQTNDGKWYICDYSKNGTTVNGRRIEKNNYVPLNAGDAIACAGVAVENPVKKKGAGKIIGISLAVLAVCAAIVLVVVIKPWPWSADKVYKEYNPSVLFMACGYHFEVECGALDISQIDDPNSIGQKLYSSFVIVDEDGEKYIQRYTGDNEMFGHATGFFIGKEGNIVTNLHVARPWLAETMSTSTGIKTIISVAEEHYRNKLSVLIELGYDNLIQYLPQLKVKGVLDYCIVIPNGNYCDLSNAYRCSEVIVSDNEEVDLAIMRLQQTYLPVGATYVPLKKITEKTKVALRAAQEAGVTIVLASGRPTTGIVPIAKEIGLDEYGGYILSFNGAVVTNFKTGEIVFETVLPHDKIQELYDASQNYGVSIVSYKDGWIVTENVDDKYVEIEARIINMPVVKVDSFVDALTHPVTKCLMLGDGDYLEKVEVEVNNLFGDVLNIYRSEPFFLEIMPQNVDKAYSLERLLAHLNLSRDEMVACGDGFNDLSMVRYAGLGVAMGNAQQVVKEVADFVTASNDEDGLVLVVERFFR